MSAPHSEGALAGNNLRDSRSWEVGLPYLAPPLSDNDRLHFQAKARIVRQLRSDANLLARHYHLPSGLNRVHIELHWRPATSRARDHANMNATLKPLIDGLVDYGLVPDDNTEHVTTDCVIEPVGQPSRVWLTITERTGGQA